LRAGSFANAEEAGQESQYAGNGTKSDMSLQEKLQRHQNQIRLALDDGFLGLGFQPLHAGSQFLRLSGEAIPLVSDTTQLLPLVANLLGATACFMPPCIPAFFLVWKACSSGTLSLEVMNLAREDHGVQNKKIG
jgi:hypothetical protein